MAIQPSDVTLRTGLRPGDLGMVTHLHGVVYADEYHLDTTFEPYVARPLSEFALAGPGAGEIWLADHEGRMVGSLAVVRTAEPGEAQLRWFLVMPDCRGTGLGRRLMDRAMAYCREKHVHRVILWSFADLDAALHLYRAYGFIETQRQRTHLWGRVLEEIRMDLDVA